MGTLRRGTFSDVALRGLVEERAAEGRLLAEVASGRAFPVRVYLAHDLAPPSWAWLAHQLECLLLDVEAQLARDGLELGLALRSNLVYFKRRFDLLGRHADARAGRPLHDHVLLRAAPRLREAAELVAQLRVFAELPRQLIVFLDLLLGVPKPLVDLVLAQVQVLGQLRDGLPVRRLSLHALVQVPQRILLALALARPLGLLFPPFGPPAAPLRAGRLGGRLGGAPADLHAGLRHERSVAYPALLREAVGAHLLAEEAGNRREGAGRGHLRKGFAA